ncbi:DUF805 domain-containing protein [Bradyrhizobium lablabi]|nr:DUF805 domain-containing protein [Bradyrhizobium lablabi]
MAGLIVLCWMLFLALLLILPLGYFFGSPVNISFSIENLLVIFDPAALGAKSRSEIAVIVVNVLTMPLFLWVCVATSVKRLHDRDKSGWWLVLFFVVPSLYGRLEEYLPDSYWVLPLALIAFALSVWGFVELLFLRGTKWTNRFGPNPLGKEQMRARSAQARQRATPPWDQESEIEMVPHKASPPPVWRVKPGA